MDRNVFAMLCELPKTRGGLLDDGNVTIEEQVSTFVNILAHHTKNRSIQCCLGALDGTYTEASVPESDKPRYRTRKGHIATNVLGVCTRDLKFVYVLSGWESLTIDSRVLRDAITIHNGLKIPFGKFDMSDRRNWIPEEEDVMITILEGIVVDGGRCDTSSFKPVFRKYRATSSMDESAADALDNMGLETEESNIAGFSQPLSTPSNVASASSGQIQNYFSGLTMKSVYLVLNWGGEWKNHHGEYWYEGQRAKLCDFSRDSNYDKLLYKVYNVIRINRDHYQVSITTVTQTCRPSMPIEIVDDEDVALLFHRENVDPLVCISVEEIGHSLQK
ncbi:hypothetical protein Ddye_000288 [Dipteronia dyeriana]|uniref:DDE Tnp4 domain-containing protein n=1 Tax=Dipteronia dyeriana TaxID=168575 RepID=A0AAD9XLE6_9ROSI|nr:hypothetical protein Ddye_000288 [Dipteronia dyeriana]